MGEEGKAVEMTDPKGGHSATQEDGSGREAKGFEGWLQKTRQSLFRQSPKEEEEKDDDDDEEDESREKFTKLDENADVYTLATALRRADAQLGLRLRRLEEANHEDQLDREVGQVSALVTSLAVLDAASVLKLSSLDAVSKFATFFYTDHRLEGEALNGLLATPLLSAALDVRYELRSKRALRYELAFFVVLACAYSTLVNLQLFHDDDHGFIGSFVAENYVLAAICMVLAWYFTARVALLRWTILKFEQNNYGLSSERRRRNTSRTSCVGGCFLLACYAPFWVVEMVVTLPWLIFMMWTKKTSDLLEDLKERCTSVVCGTGNDLHEMWERFYCSPQDVYGFVAYLAGLPKLWRSEALNWIEVLFVGTVWMTVFRTAISLGSTPENAPSYVDKDDNHYTAFLTLGLLLMWLRFLEYLKYWEPTAPFVALLTKLVYVDLLPFLFVLFFLLCACVHALHTSLGDKDLDYFGDDVDEHPYRTLPNAFLSVYYLAFVGDIEPNEFRRDLDKIFFSLFIFFMIVVISAEIKFEFLSSAT